MVFTPSVPFGPSSHVTINIPGGRNGVRSTSGALLTASVTDHFRTGGYSQQALAQMLAQQGYLPMTFTPVSTGLKRAQSQVSAPDPASLTPAGQAYSPPAGTFTFDQGYPSSLQSLWNPNGANVLLRGAVMAFQSQHNMTIDGNLTPKFWTALFLAQERGERNQNGYTYAVADQRDPETLTIYHNGHFAMRSLTNTGIPVSPTVNGTFPVYARYRFQIMSGTNPGGSHYADPVSFVSYFNGGDAVHYFPRGGYGYQQSLGCVELPYSQAERAYPFLTYGSLVTVQG
jgi:lipoprotein-anchoring transpeptidase ErfK/SrfK